MKSSLLIGSILAAAAVFSSACLARKSESNVTLAALKDARGAPDPLLQERTAEWRAEFLDPATDLKVKGRLLGQLRHGQGPKGEDPRDTEVVAEALGLFDSLADPERREDVLKSLRGVPSEALLLKALDVLRNDVDREVRGDAATLLAYFDDERATAGIRWSEANDVSPRVREDCAEALASRANR